MKLLHKFAGLTFVLISLLFFSRCSVREATEHDIEGPPNMSSIVEKAPTVPFCELVRSVGRYDKTVVRTSALLYVDRENETLYDPDCDTENTHAWVEFDPSYVYTDKKVRETLTELIRPRLDSPTRKARVTIVGRFEGPKDGPYGHLDGYQFRFSIMRLEGAEPSDITK